MSMSVFVSHVFEDRAYRDQINGWAQRGLLGDVVITGETADVRQGGDRAIQSHLNPYLKGAGALLVLVGQNSHNRPWLDHEVQHAQSHHKKILVVRIGGTNGAAPPAVRGYGELLLDPTAIRRALGT